nr:hypothetical protein [Micromonospora sp. DSM 115978]
FSADSSRSADNRDDPDYWRAKAAAARERARNLPWTSDPELRAQVDAILAMEPSDRLRQLQAESDLFASAVLVEDKAVRWSTRRHV